MFTRRRAASCPGGRPNWRRYSRLNCEGLSYPTWYPMVATSCAPDMRRRRDFCRRICFWNWIGLSAVTAWKLRVKRGRAHAARSGEVYDAEWLAVVVGDPANGPADLGQSAVGESNLAHALTQRTGHEPPQDLAFDRRRQHVSVARTVQQSQHPSDGVKQLGRDVGDSESGRRGGGLVSSWRLWGDRCGSVQEQRRDGR